jgi:four helix bundle protein
MSASFKDLRVWRESMELAIEIYRGTVGFPKYELYGLTQQLRRAAVSIPSNIAEGKGHRSNREFGNFLMHARGSLLEVQTQLMIAMELQYLAPEEGKRLLASSDTIGRGLNGLINSLRKDGVERLTNGQRPATNDRSHV